MSENKRLPTRTGIATGHANERTLAAKVNPDSCQTALRPNADGTTTMLRTRGGFLDYTTLPDDSKQEQGPVCGWSYDFYPVKRDAGGSLIPHTMYDGGYLVPQMTPEAGSKTRRAGLSVKSDHVALPAVVSQYDGIHEDNTKRYHGPFYWYKGSSVVSWTKRTFTPSGLDHPYYTPIGVVRCGNAEFESFSAEPQSRKAILAAAVAHSPDGTKYIRVAKIRPVGGPMAPEYVLELADYSSSGTHVSTVTLESSIIVPPLGPGAFSQDGRQLLIAVSDSALDYCARLYAVSRPDGAGFPVFSSTPYYFGVTKPTAVVPEYSHNVVPLADSSTITGNLTNLAPYDQYAYGYFAEYDLGGALVNEIIIDTFTPKETRSLAGRSTTYVHEKNGSVAMWADYLGFTKEGIPCAVISTEKITTTVDTETYSEYRFTEIFSEMHELVQDVTLGGYRTVKKYYANLKKDTESGTYYQKTESGVSRIERAVNICVGNSVSWRDEHSYTGPRVTTETGSTGDIGSYLYDTATYVVEETGESGIRKETHTEAHAGYITINPVAADFIDGAVAVFMHQPLGGRDSITDSSYKVATENILRRHYVTGVIIEEVYGRDVSYNTTDTAESDPPESVSAELLIINPLPGATAQTRSHFFFNWSGDVLMDYRGAFQGSAAWCPFGNSFLMVHKWPTTQYGGYFFREKRGWRPLALNPDEPSNTYPPKSEVFAFTNLSPFA